MPPIAFSGDFQINRQPSPPWESKGQDWLWLTWEWSDHQRRGKWVYARLDNKVAIHYIRTAIPAVTSTRLHLFYCYTLEINHLFYFRKSLELLEKQNSSQPFFLYISYQSPHTPIVQPPEKYLSRYPSVTKWRSTYNKRGLEAHLHRAATITVIIPILMSWF